MAVKLIMFSCSTIKYLFNTCTATLPKNMFSFVISTASKKIYLALTFTCFWIGTETYNLFTLLLSF